MGNVSNNTKSMFQLPTVKSYKLTESSQCAPIDFARMENHCSHGLAWIFMAVTARCCHLIHTHAGARASCCCSCSCSCSGCCCCTCSLSCSCFCSSSCSCSCYCCRGAQYKIIKKGIVQEVRNLTWNHLRACVHEPCAVSPISLLSHAYGLPM